MLTKRRMKSIAVIGLFPLVAAASGCSQRYVARGATFAPMPAPGGQAIVYVYMLPGNGRGYRLTIDGEEGPVIGPGAYHAFLAEPGELEITARVHLPGWQPALLTRALSSTGEVTLEVESGNTYYVRGNANENQTTGEYDIGLATVPETTGSVEVKLCRLPQ